MPVPASSVNVRITKQTHQSLSTLAKESGVSMQTVLDKAVEAYRRQSFLEALNNDFATLKDSAEEWAEEMEERKLWERTLADGMERL